MNPRSLRNTMNSKPSSDIDDPYAHMKVSREMKKVGNLRAAESALRSAVVAADQLPHAEYKRDLLLECKKYLADSEYQSRPGVTLPDLKTAYHSVLSLPVSARLELASFYAQHGAMPEARDLCNEALTIGVDDLISDDIKINDMLNRGRELQARLNDVLGPDELQNLVSENFDKIDTDKDGFLHESELRRAQFDLTITPAGQEMIRHLLYHYLEIERSSSDEWGLDINGISTRDVDAFEKKQRSSWKRMSE